VSLVFRLLALAAAAGLLAGCAGTTAQRVSDTTPERRIVQTKTDTASPQLLSEIEAWLLEGRLSPAGGELLARVAPTRPLSPEIDRQVAAELQKLETKAELPITINAQVRRWIDILQTRYHSKFKLWLSRSGRYIPMMRAILQQYGLPQDLVYLALIESGFSCRAYSRAAAAGPWQFIRSTGRRYGLKVNAWVDERRDPVKSTHAAAQYLRDLYAEFGTWYLACAAYNAGETKIRRALKYHKADNFWDIANPSKRRSYIKRETRNYVPKMIAAALIAKNPQRYGFHGVDYQEPLAFDTVRLTIPVDLKLLAKELGTTYQTLKDLNPELRHAVTPQDGSAYDLRLPKNSPQAFLAYLHRFKAKPIKTYIAHRLRPGENPGTVARKYKVSVKTLLRVNNIKDARRLRAGRILKVPVRSSYLARTRSRSKKTSSRSSAKTARPAPARNKNPSGLIHVVRSGENPWTIAQRYNVSHQELLAANGISRRGRIKVGQRLIIPGRAGGYRKTTTTVVHVVRSGENPWTIAQKYNVSCKKLMAWNKITNQHRLKIGQKLAVHLNKDEAG